MYLLCPSNFRIIVSMNVFWGATWPLRTGIFYSVLDVAFSMEKSIWVSSTMTILQTHFGVFPNGRQHLFVILQHRWSRKYRAIVAKKKRQISIIKTDPLLWHIWRIIESFTIRINGRLKNYEREVHIDVLTTSIWLKNRHEKSVDHQEMKNRWLSIASFTFQSKISCRTHQESINRLLGHVYILKMSRDTSRNT